MNYLKVAKITGLVTGTSATTVGSVYGTQYLNEYIKDKDNLRKNLTEAGKTIIELDSTYKSEIQKLTDINNKLTSKLDSIRWSLEKGKDLIMLDIKKIRDAKQTLQGRIDLIHKSDKLLEEPYKKIAENFQNASYLAQT